MPNGQKTTLRYNEAVGKQKVAQIYILDNPFYLLIVLCSHLGWVRLLASLWCGSRISNCFIGYKIACTVKSLALKAVLPKQSLLMIFFSPACVFCWTICNLYLSSSQGLFQVGFHKHLDHQRYFWIIAVWLLTFILKVCCILILSL